MIYCLVNNVCILGLQLIKANKCKLVNAQCKHGLLGGEVVTGQQCRPFAMVLEIIGRNNYYQLHVCQGKILGKQRQYAVQAA